MAALGATTATAADPASVGGGDGSPNENVQYMLEARISALQANIPPQKAAEMQQAHTGTLCLLNAV